MAGILLVYPHVIETEAPGGRGAGRPWGGAPSVGARPRGGGPQGVGRHTIRRLFTWGRRAPGGGARPGGWGPSGQVPTNGSGRARREPHQPSVSTCPRVVSFLSR